MAYIKPMFLLLFVLGIVAAVSSRHAAKHYPVEDAGNQDESSLVKKTLKRHGSSLTSAFDISKEKNERKVSSVTDMDNSDSGDVSFDVLNPNNGVTWEAINIYIEQGEKDMDLPAEVDPGHHLRYHVQGVQGGAAGVFTYYLSGRDLTLAFMFYHDLYDYGRYNVKILPWELQSEQDLYDEMFEDSLIADDEMHFIDLGFGFSARAKMSTSDPATITVRNFKMPPML